MAFRPNYRQARNERSRAKDQKKQEKLRRREEDAARRKGEAGVDPDSTLGGPTAEEVQLSAGNT